MEYAGRFEHSLQSRGGAAGSVAMCSWGRGKVRMLHQRLLDALDSSSPLLFIEAIPGSGKRTVLRQWEGRDDGRLGETRLRFEAKRMPPDPRALARTFWTALGHRLRQRLPPLPEQDARLAEAVLGRLREMRRPIALAVHDAESLDENTFELVLTLLDAGVRLIIAGSDLSLPMSVARRQGIYHSTLDDRDLRFTRVETDALIEEAGAELDSDAAAALHRATGGHPGTIMTCLTRLPIETAAGVITRERAAAVHLAERPPRNGRSGFADFLSTTVQLPRFTMSEAAMLTGADDGGARYLSRMLALDLGCMEWHTGLHERVFRWEERTRLVLRRAMQQAPGAESVQIGRLIAAARTTGDEELLISALVRSGELDEAETLLREKVWDLLPNAMDPLWSGLERLSPLALLERPAMLSARLRLSPRRAASPACEQAARSAGRRIVEVAAGSPWARVGHLAYGIGFALYAGEKERLIDLYTRTRALIADLLASGASAAAGPQEVSELLLIADLAFRSGNTIPAAEIGGFASRLIELDPERLDPRGERLAFARRLILHDRRARGHEDVLDPEPLLADPQFLRRDVDIVVAEMALMWTALDGGDFEVADAHLRVAGVRVADPEGWPILPLMRAHLAVHRRAPAELETNVSAYERSTLAEPGPFAQQPHSRLERVMGFLSRKAGRPVASPGYLPVVPEPGITFYPRTELTVHLMEALYALREDRPAAARGALAEAAAVSPRRDLGLYTLANATGNEVRALHELAENVPGGPELRLDRALRFAGNLHSPQIELSDREREVLDLLRGGATNPEMAQAMFVSVNTVKFHRMNLMRKLEARSRHELLEAAARLGL